MSNKITNFFEKQSHGVQLTLTAIAATFLTATTLLSYQTYTRHRNLKRERRPSTSITLIQPDDKPTIDESLVLELLARNIAFFGPEAVDRYRRSFVVVLGAGAVGSWASLMLVRSGLEHIRIVDRDVVHLESLTRHAVATFHDVGQGKAKLMRRALAGIAPQAEVEAVQTEVVSVACLERLLAGEPDFVVDTFSDVKSKVMLAQYCHARGIKIVSAMAAGAKADPSLIQMTDINDTAADPLCRMYRRQLKKLGIDRGIPVVYSIEKTLNLKEGQAMESERLPVLGSVASMFGLSLVTYIIVQLTEFSAYKLPTNTMRDGVYARMQKELLAREEYVFGNKTEFLNVKEIGYIFDELWQGKSAISGAQDKALVMTRWDKTKVSSLTNTVLMTKEEANAHDKLPLETDLVQHYGPDIVNKIIKQFELEKKVQRQWNTTQ